MPAPDDGLLRPRILALCLCAAGSRQAGRLVCPVATDAGPGKLQPVECPRPDPRRDQGDAYRQNLRSCRYELDGEETVAS